MTTRRTNRRNPDLSNTLTLERRADGSYGLGRTFQARQRQLVQQNAIARTRRIIRGETAFLDRSQMQDQVRRMFARFGGTFNARPRRDGRYTNPLTGRAISLPRNQAEFNQLERRMRERVAPNEAAVVTRRFEASVRTIR